MENASTTSRRKLPASINPNPPAKFTIVAYHLAVSDALEPSTGATTGGTFDIPTHVRNVADDRPQKNLLYVSGIRNANPS